MKFHRLLMLAPLMFGLAPSASFADCNPACRGQKVCRYDSTRNPQFYCQRPPSAASKSSNFFDEYEQPKAKSNATKAAAKRDGPDFDAAKSAKATPASGTSVPKRASEPNAQYNPKEIGNDRKQK